MMSPSLIDSLLLPHLFFDGRDEKNILKDIHYKSDSSKFTGLTSPAGNENMIFVTDNYGGINDQHRIVQIDFQRSLIFTTKVALYEPRRNNDFRNAVTPQGGRRIFAFFSMTLT